MLDPHATVTTTALLEGLFDEGNEDVWQEFHQRYRPVFLGVARGMGLAPEDAADVAQESLMHFLRDYRAGKYDRERGRLRHWVRGIVRNRVRELRCRRDVEPTTGGESKLGDLPSDNELDQLWEAEVRKKVLADALDALKRGSDFQASTLRAFELYALQARPPQEVADELGLTLRAVYLAKHQCARRLRELADRLAEAYELL